jgi:hypothetical protein
LLILFVGFIWCRHTGQPEIDKIPSYVIPPPVVDICTVLADVGDNYITHAWIHIPNGLDPSMVDALSKVTQLKIRGVNSSTPLARYKRVIMVASVAKLSAIFSLNISKIKE